MCKDFLKVFQEHQEEGVGQSLSKNGQIINKLTLCLAEDKENEVTSTWLVTPEGIKIRRITKPEFEMLQKFALTGM